MYRIRFHGRGGHGIKTAGRILGTAFFLAGYEVQDAPHYGAERRGAPIYSSVRAQQHQAIHERGIIRHPDLIVLADDSLLALPMAAVLAGANQHTTLLICSPHTVAADRKQTAAVGQLLTFAPQQSMGSSGIEPLSSSCAGAAAQLLGILDAPILEEAVRLELSHYPEKMVAENIQSALAAFNALKANTGQVTPAPEEEIMLPDWLDLPFEEAAVSAPTIHTTGSSLTLNTGTWRTLRPVINQERCTNCGLCNTYCPESAISLNVDNQPIIDYLHCKGCLICFNQCPPKAIDARAESDQPNHSKTEEAP